MEGKSEKTAAVGRRRQLNSKSFKLAVRSVLTACSKEEFCKAFPNFTAAEHERLHRLYIQVITSLHENIEDEFESLCLETQAGTTLDIVEQLVEEQSLDPLSTERSNIKEVGQYLSEAKKNEIHYLTSMLKKAEEQKRVLSARLELLKKERQDFSGAAGAIDKLRSGILNYGAGNNTGLRNV